MTEYTIIQETTQLDMTRKVNAMLNDDWKCQGGVATMIWQGCFYYTQAMIKERK